MSLSTYIQLRIALALVLLEHKPSDVPLSEYLARLKDEVRSRTGQGSGDEGRGSSLRVSQNRAGTSSAMGGLPGERIEQVVVAPSGIPAHLYIATPQPPTFASASLEPTTSFPPLTALPPLPPLPPLPSLPPPPPAAPPPQPSRFFPLPSTAPTAAAPPVPLPPDLLLRVVASVRLQVDVAFPPAPTESAAGGAVAAAGEEERENEAFAKFVKVEELLAWVIQRVGDLPTCAEGRGEGVGAAEVEPGRNEIERAIASLLLRLLPAILPRSSLQPSVASLLLRFVPTSPAVALSQLLPEVLEALVSMLSRAGEVGAEAEKQMEGEVDVVLSLIHLVFTALPSTLPSTSTVAPSSPSPSPSTPLQASINALTLALSSPVVDAFFTRLRPRSAGDGGGEEEGEVGLESRVMGVMEGCWELVEVLER